MGWFKTKRTKQLEQQLAQTTAQLQDVSQQHSDLETRLHQLEPRMQQLEVVSAKLEQIQAERDRRQISTEPWIELIGEKLDENNRLQIELDWNPAFIQNLRDNGFTGGDEVAIVRKWLALLTNQIIDTMSASEIEELTRDPNRYV